MKRAHPEYALHRAVVQILKLQCNPNVLWYHVPSGNKLAKRTAAHNKLMGVRAGVADLVFLVNGKSYFMEFKSLKGRHSPEQKRFELDAWDAGTGGYATIRSIDQAITWLKIWQVIRSHSHAIEQRRAA